MHAAGVNAAKGTSIYSSCCILLDGQPCLSGSTICSSRSTYIEAAKSATWSLHVALFVDNAVILILA